ncbi:ATP-dependent helicase [Candidatus Saccharibacteria bacterium]|nr:ATP-dependent helicase [Candidatus Saccharibacteria bacterium]
MSEFEKAYKALNVQQRQAVETIDGPVLVIAGPGTGKTQLLSTRVANILKSTDTRPNNILCLTYTNKAAVNMKERIIHLAGQEGARVPASTFHSFAAEIMNLYPDNFWKAARLVIAPESVQLDIIESIVKRLPVDNPLALKFAGQYTLLSSIQRAIGLAKDAGLTPGKLKVLIKFNLSYIDQIEEPLVKILDQRLRAKKLPALAAEVEGLTKQEIAIDLYPLTSLSRVINDSLHQAIEADEGTGKASHTSQWKSRWIQAVDGQKAMFKERQRNQWWLELAGVYQTYRDELHHRGFYDFADMLVEVIAQLEQTPAMLADVQERFSYVLIDEFQDSTPAQLRLAHLVADHYSAEGKPNLMVVGDDDQTIYKFNGAQVNNMLNFERHYPKLSKIVLTDNYRSSQDILDFAKRVIEQAEIRLVDLDPSLKKELIAKKPPSKSGQIKILAYSSSELQMSEIARDIKRYYRPDTAVAVLARGHQSLIKMASVMQQLKVPVRYEQSANILDQPIIEQVYLVAKLLVAIQDGDKSSVNALIHKILRWESWGLEPRQLWKLAATNFKSKNWLDSLLESQDSQLRTIGQWFVWLAGCADSQPLAVTIEQIIGLRPSVGFSSPLRDYFLSSTKQKTNAYFHGLSAIQLLRNLVYEFGRERHPTITDLVRYVEINKLNEIIVPDESPFITGANAVQLLSVHKAKGLEFDHVYIIDAIEDNWRPKSGGRKPPSNLPLQPVGDDFDDYIRLMYVALTRAKASITISGYYSDHSGKDVALSPIIQSIKPFKKIGEKNRKALIDVMEENLRWPQLEAGEAKAILSARLEDFNLNVTHLLHFLDVDLGGPRYFKERHLLKLPELKTPHQAFGTAIHAALRSAQHQANKRRFSLAMVTKEFAAALRNEQLMPVEHKRQLGKGQQLLKRLFDDLGYKIPVGSLAEYELRDIKLGTARLSGTLDRIDKIKNQTRIIDYKTGRPLSFFDTKDQSQMLKAYRHKMQLIFYALLLEAKDRPSPKISGEMVYVEASKTKALSRIYVPNNTDKARLSKLIEAVWQRIQKLDFPNTSKYPPGLTGIKQFEQDLISG